MTIYRQETKIFTMLGEVGMANESTKPCTQVYGWLNTMNEQGCMTCRAHHQSMRALVMPTLFIHCIEPFAHLFAWFLLIR